MSKIERTNTIDTSVLEQPGGTLVIGEFSNEAIDRIGVLQQGYLSQFGENALWLPRGNEIHVTVIPVTRPKAYEPIDELNQRIATSTPLASRALMQTIDQYGNPLGYEASFDTLVASQAAIALRTDTSDWMNRFRSVFVDRFTSQGPAEPLGRAGKGIPSITHTTIGRYTEALDLAEVKKYTQHVNATLDPITVVFNSLTLVREERIYGQGCKPI